MDLLPFKRDYDPVGTVDDELLRVCVRAAYVLVDVEGERELVFCPKYMVLSWTFRSSTRTRKR